MRGFLVAAAICLAFPVAAQESVSLGSGAVLRGLDKVSGETTDMDLSNGASTEYGSLRIEMTECRYPEGNLAGDAFAFTKVWERDAATPIFSGWMIGSSPALSALDHARYDVWVMRCKTE
ncbi:MULTISPECIES: DUF2155 domain-containing protein [unclassified Marinovum]